MKKIILFWVFCLGLVLSAGGSLAAGNLDTVALSNGTVIQGTILESSNERVKIQTMDGTVMVFDMTDVEQIRRGAVQSQTVPVETVTQTTRTVEMRNPLRKDPTLAFHLSCYYPGGGQFYSGQSGKGALQLGLVIGGIILAVAEAPQYEDYYDYWGYYVGTEKTGGNDGACTAGICLAVGSWIWSVVDAPGCAEKYNREHGLTLYEDPLKQKTLALEPVLFNKGDVSSTGMQVAYRF